MSWWVFVEFERTKCSPCHSPLPSRVPAKHRAPPSLACTTMNYHPLPCTTRHPAQPSPSRLPSTVSGQSLAHCCGICEECMSRICTKLNWSRELHWWEIFAVTTNFAAGPDSQHPCWSFVRFTLFKFKACALASQWVSQVTFQISCQHCKLVSCLFFVYISKNLADGGYAGALTNWRG